MFSFFSFFHYILAIPVMPRAPCPLHNPQVAGLPTNLRFLQDLAAHPAFLDMDLDTGAPLVLCVCV